MKLSVKEWIYATVSLGFFARAMFLAFYPDRTLDSCWYILMAFQLDVWVVQSYLFRDK